MPLLEIWNTNDNPELFGLLVISFLMSDAPVFAINRMNHSYNWRVMAVLLFGIVLLGQNKGEGIDKPGKFYSNTNASWHLGQTH